MLAMFHISLWELLLIVASIGIFVSMIGFISSLFRPGHSTHCRRGLKVPILLAILVGGVLASLLGTRRVVHQTAHQYDAEHYVIDPPIVEVKATRISPDPSLEALWDKLTKSKINLDGEASEPVVEPKSESVKIAAKTNFGLGKKGGLPPEWVLTPPKQVGMIYRESVSSDPFVTEAECRQQLEEKQLPQVVARRLNHLIAGRGGYAVDLEGPLPPGIGPDYILREICRDEFTGTVDTSVGEMKKVHVLLEFDKNIDNYLVDAWLRHERDTRLASVGKVAALSLTGLAAIYGLLRFDTWSKGYYSRQLLVGGTLAIIAFAVVLLKS